MELLKIIFITRLKPMLKTLLINTLLKEARSRSLLFLGIFNIIILLVMVTVVKLLGENTLAQEGLSVVGGGVMGIYFLVINWWITILAYLLGTSAIASDLRSGIVSQLVSFPIPRWQYILVRIVGVWIIVLGFYFVSNFLGGFVFSVITGVEVSFGGAIVAFLINLLPLLAAITLAVFLSLYIQRIFAFVLCSFLSVIVQISTSGITKIGLERALSEFDLYKSIGLFFHFLFPHVSVWSNYASSFIFGTEASFNSMFEVPHLVVITMVWIGLISFIFKKKEL
tara:strand:+ start:99326 stop:100171 length:846 start_codon:yes stop_codon:yes gene_type:complete